MALDNLNDEIQALEETIDGLDEQEALLAAELKAKKEKRAAEEEAIKKQEAEERAKAKQRTTYIPIKGDAVDELMAKHINECEHWVPVRRQGDGNYLYGQRKINAKLKNDKLVIKVGGGYMLMEEFLKNNAEAEEKAF